MDDFLVIFVTASSAREAEALARALVAGGASACVNIVSRVVSIYEWKGEIAREAEALLIIKSRRDRFLLVREIVEANHSYDVPEVIAASLDEISPKYRAYLQGFFEKNA